jgi:FkbM family methyltransferase
MRHFLVHGEIELRLVPLLCRRDCDSLDVGANEGAYLHLMIPNSRAVLAFEPIPALAAALTSKFGARVVVHAIALSRETGGAVLHVPSCGGIAVTGLASLAPAPSVVGDGIPDKLDVRTATLDGLYADDAGFIKIDVEGHEEAMLDGAAKTIARCRPRILVEMEERFASGVIERGRRRFQAVGYRGFYIHDRQARAIESFDPQRLQREADITGFIGGGKRAAISYVNNFLFLPEEECPSLLPRIERQLARAWR